MTDLTVAQAHRLHRALEDTREQLTQHIDHIIDQLQTALTHVSASRVPLTNRLAEIAIAELVEHDPTATPDVIIEVVAGFHSLSPDDILSTRKSKETARARQIAMWLCRQLTDLSLPRLGQVFDRDHTTVMHAEHKIQAEADTDPAMVEQLKELTTMINRQAAMNALRGARHNNTSRGAA